jgi:hypothetical protein
MAQFHADRKARAEAMLTVYFGQYFSFDFGKLDTLTAMINYGATSLEPVGYNLVASCTDTMAGHILRNKVRPQFVTDKGSVEQKERAAAMQRGVEGEFFAAGLYGTRARSVCKRGLILDAGGVKWTVDVANKRIDSCLVWPHEFFVPPEEERRDCVTQMVHIFDVDRQVLLGAFPDFADEINAAKPVTAQNSAPDMITDRVEVREAWHLPSTRVEKAKTGEDADEHGNAPHDGLRVLAIEGVTLVSEPWDFDFFPVSWFKPMGAEGSYWSRGYPERLAGAQQKLNEYQDRIDAILKLHARPLLVTWLRAGLNPAKITNNVATILTSKVPPSQALWQMTPQAVPRELVERVQAIIAWGEKQAGLSELSINAQKPAGLGEHAPALRHLADQESVRQTEIFSAWEQFYLDSAKIVVACLRMLVEKVPDYESTFANNEEFQRVKWAKVDLGADKYHLTCQPSNLLPLTPSARIATLLEMVQAGMITPREAMSRFTNPDVKDLLGDQSAAEENVERLLSKAAREDGVVAHAYMDLSLLMTKCRERINRLEADGEDDAVVDRLRQLFSNAQALSLQTTADVSNAMALGERRAMAPTAGVGQAPPAPAGATALPPAPAEAPLPLGP